MLTTPRPSLQAATYLCFPFGCLRFSRQTSQPWLQRGKTRLHSLPPSKSQTAPLPGYALARTVFLLTSTGIITRTIWFHKPREPGRRLTHSFWLAYAHTRAHKDQRGDSQSRPPWRLSPVSPAPRALAHTQIEKFHQGPESFMTNDHPPHPNFLPTLPQPMRDRTWNTNMRACAHKHLQSQKWGCVSTCGMEGSDYTLAAWPGEFLLS